MTPEHKARAGFCLQCGFVTGSVLVTTGAYVGGPEQWRLLSGVISLSALPLSLLAALCLPESPRWQLRAGHAERAAETLRRIARRNGRASAPCLVEAIAAAGLGAFAADDVHLPAVRDAWQALLRRYNVTDVQYVSALGSHSNRCTATVRFSAPKAHGAVRAAAAPYVVEVSSRLCVALAAGEKVPRIGSYRQRAVKSLSVHGAACT